MHLFVWENWIMSICEQDEFSGLYDQITANYKGWVDDKMYGRVR